MPNQGPATNPGDEGSAKYPGGFKMSETRAPRSVLGYDLIGYMVTRMTASGEGHARLFMMCPFDTSCVARL